MAKRFGAANTDTSPIVANPAVNAAGKGWSGPLFVRRYMRDHLIVEPIRDAREMLLSQICSATDITSSKNLIGRLQEALDEVNLLKGLLSICASCKRIKDEHESCHPLESYIQAHSEAKFPHGLCPECLRKLCPDYYDQ